ncbi:MAG: hypothetical protein AB8G77_19040 [Rhodothermales bacterium]
MRVTIKRQRIGLVDLLEALHSSDHLWSCCLFRTLSWIPNQVEDDKRKS